MGLIEEIELDLGIRPGRVGPGRQAKMVSAQFERELTEADLSMPPAEIQTPAPLKKIRDSHHALARVLATGESEAMAAAITGYSNSRISILKADPQFQELVEFYREKGSEAVADLRSRMANMGMDALAELQDRLDENPDDFSIGQLRELVKDMADRTGHAPQRGPTNVTNVNVNLSDKMAVARARVAESLAARTSKVIEHE